MEENNYKRERKQDVKGELKALDLKLPSSLNTEQAVLGAVLLDREAYSIVESMLHRDMFAFEAHRLIWDAIVALANRRFPIDLLTVTEELKKVKNSSGADYLDMVGGPYYLVELTNKVASYANLEFHARILVQIWIRSRLMQNLYRNIRLAESDEMDCFDLLSKVQVELGQMTDFVTKVGGGGKRIPDLLKEIKSFIHNPELMQKSYVYTGISDLDYILSGFAGGELTIIAGRPGSGKTTLAIDIMVRMALSGIPSAFFSYEMPTSELLLKIMGNMTEINSKKFRHPETIQDYELLQIDAAVSKIEGLPFNIVDEVSGLDATRIRTKIASLKNRFGVRIVFIDYLQLIPMMKGTERISTADAIGKTTKALKEMAKEFNITIVVMSQLTRECESNKYARPILKNLRDSGHIESDADRVLFVWRPEYHNYQTIDYLGKEMDTWGKACIIQEKFRGGSPGETWLRCKLEFSKFENLTQSYLEPIERPEDFDWNDSKIQAKQTIEIGGTDNRLSDDLPF